MSNYQLKESTKETLYPIQNKNTNKFLTGPQGVETLPITQMEDCITSLWYCPNFWQRLIFLFTGEITFACRSSQHPPIAIFMGDHVEKVLDEND